MSGLEGECIEQVNLGWWGSLVSLCSPRFLSARVTEFFLVIKLAGA